MRTDKLTTRFQSALSDAQSLAVGRDNQFIEATHVLLALLAQDASTVSQVLSSTGVNVNALNVKLNEALERLPKVEGHQGDVQLSNEFIRLLNQTDKLAQQRNDQFISSELFLLALIDAKSSASDILKSAGADKDQIVQAIENVRGGESVDDANAEENRLVVWSFEVANKVEQIHAGLFSKAINVLKSGKDLGKREFFVCGVCGNTVEDIVPEKCPIFNAPMTRFSKVD